MDMEACNLCEKHFKTKGSLDRHTRLVHGENNAKVQCKICGKGLKSNIRLVEHLKNFHEKKKYFKCDHCEKAFGLKTILDQHIKFVHL